MLLSEVSTYTLSTFKVVESTKYHPLRNEMIFFCVQYKGKGGETTIRMFSRLLLRVFHQGHNTKPADKVK